MRKSRFTVLSSFVLILSILGIGAAINASGSPFLDSIKHFLNAEVSLPAATTLTPRNTWARNWAKNDLLSAAYRPLNSPLAPESAFTPGNLVVYRVGDGTATVSNLSAPVFLDEYTSAGALVQSIPLPTSSGGSVHAITASGTATSEGLITRSKDGTKLAVQGYDAAPGVAQIAATVTGTPVTAGVVTAATNASPIVVTASTTGGNTGTVGMADGQSVTLVSIGGNTNANGTYFVKVSGLSNNTFALYTDAGLTTPRAGNAAYTSGGTWADPSITAHLRVVGSVASDGTIDSSTTTTTFNGANIRGSAIDGANIWMSGSTTGVVSTTLGASGAGTIVSGSPSNLRYINVFNNQLYVTSGSGTSVGVNTVGSGEPTSAATASLSGSITGATNATPIVVTTGSTSGMSDGQTVTISGVVGNTNANVTCYLKVQSATTFALFIDSALTVGRTGNAVYTSGGTWSVNTNPTALQVVDTGVSPYGFFFARLGSGATFNGYDTAYIADDTNTTGGIQKFSYNGTAWVLKNTVTSPINGSRGIAGSVSGTTVTLYITADSTSVNALYKMVDTSGFDSNNNGTYGTALVSLSNSTDKKVLRGIAFAPTLPFAVASFSPADATTGIPTNSSISVTFNHAANPATISTNTADTNCTGSLQVSKDNFATCVQMLASPTTGDNTTFSVTPLASLAPGTNYKVQVVTSAKDFSGIPLAFSAAQATGFTTAAAAPPSVQLTVSANSGSEAAQTVIAVNAVASAPVTGNQTVTVAVTGTGITAGDYTLTNTTITIPNGSTVGSVNFTVVDDAVYEGPETATLTISSPSAGITLGSPTTQNISIADNDAPPATMTVNTNDDVDNGACLVSHCSLREAINAANLNADISTINFGIAGSGPFTITLVSALPTITQPIIIDGFSQSGASANTLASGDNAVMMIEINGANTSSGSNGLTITAGNSTVKGLVLNRSQGYAIVLSTAGGNTVSGNFIGTDPTGTVWSTLPSGVLYGINVLTAGNTIGGTTPATRNVIIAGSSFAAGDAIDLTGPGASSDLVQGNYLGTDKNGAAKLGNTGIGVFLENSSGNGNVIGGTTGTTPGGACTGACNLLSGTNLGIQSNSPGSATIQGNFIGTNASGTAAIPNTGSGIIFTFIASGTGNVIGGATASARNVISGNSNVSGIQIQPGPIVTIKGNYIGVGTDGVTSLPNFSGIDTSGSNSVIGGAAAGEGNIIANSLTFGLRVGGSGVGNAIRGNGIYGNAGRGIDFGFQVPNDNQDPDTGPNDLQNYPVITSAFAGPTNTISATLNTNPNSTAGYSVDFFSSPSCDPSGFGQGRTYLGSVTTNATNGNGDTGTFTFNSPTTLTAGQIITATATTPVVAGVSETSEFSACFAIAASQGTTSLALGSSVNPSTVGQSVTFTATVSVASGTGTPTGNVTFLDGATGIGCSAQPMTAGGVATCTTSALTQGSHTINATYNGDSNFVGSSNSVSQTVKGTTSLALGTSVSPSTVGQSVTFTATITVASGTGTPTGNVTFLDGATGIGCSAQPMTAGGVATCTTSALTQGSHTINATYNGDGNFVGSSNSVSQVVKGTTTLSVGTSVNPSTVGQSVTFTATITVGSGTGTPTGNVTFLDGATGIGCSAQPMTAGGVATCTTSALTQGSHTINATYNGDGNFVGSSNSVSQTVKGTTSLALGTSGSPSVVGQSVTFTATISVVAGTGAPTGTVAFVDSLTASAIPGCSAKAVSSNQATCTSNSLAQGSHTITATYSGDSNFAGSSSTVNQFVNSAGATHFSITAPSNVTAGSAFSITVTALDPSNNTVTGYTGTVMFTTTDSNPNVVLPNNYTFIPSDNGVHTFAGAKLVTAGSQTITATDTSTAITGTSNSITVNPASATHFTVNAPPTVTSGNAFSFTVTARDSFNNIATSYGGTVTFTKTDGGAGSSVPANYTFVPADNGVHTFTSGATLVTAGNQTITATDTVTSAISGTSNNINVVTATCGTAPRNMLAWYKGENNALDSRGGYDGSFQGTAAYNPGKVNQGFSFNGSSFVTVPAGPVSGSLNMAGNAVTIDGWINPSVVSGDTVYFGKTSSGANDFVVLREFGELLGIVKIAGVEHFVVPSPSGLDLPANTWTHVALTYDGTNAQMYVNGVASGSPSTFSGGIDNDASPFDIGGRSGGLFFNGKIDEVEVFNRALSGTELAGIYNASTAGKCTDVGPGSGLVGWWPGDGDARDISGSGSNGTFMNPANPSGDYGAGEVGQDFSFTNPNARVEAPSTALPIGGSDRTMEMWVKINSYNAFSEDFFAGYGTFGSSTQIYALGTNPSHQLQFSNWGASIFGPVLNLGTWYHIAVTNTGNNITLYLNGAPVSSGTLTLNTSSGTTFYIGEVGADTTRELNGAVDEVSVYNRALTANEIASVFNAGVAGKYKFVTTPTGSNVPSNAGGDATVNFTTVTAAGTTQQVPLDSSLYPSLPGGQIPLKLYYDISSAATYTGNTTVCFHLPLVTSTTAFANVRIDHLEGGVWVDRTNNGSINFGTQTACTVGLGSLSPFAIGVAVPSAATVAVSGRVLAPGGAGLRNASVVLTDAQGATRRVITNSFGSYTFDNIQSGGSYIIGVESRRFRYSTRVVQVTDTLADVDFSPIE